MKRFAPNELLGDLPFELNTVRAVLGHGFHPLKAQHRWSIPNPLPVHPQGRTPADLRLNPFFHRVKFILLPDEADGGFRIGAAKGIEPHKCPSSEYLRQRAS